MRTTSLSTSIDEEHEFLPSVPISNHVPLPSHTVQQLPGLLQADIPTGMAVPVVVLLLEVIDIQHHHAGGMRDAAVGERRQYLTELSPVEQPGQDVGILFHG